MFCPRCATENDAKLSYCRQCGLQMKAVRLALEGQVEEGTAKFTKGYESVASGLVTFAIFLSIAIVTWFFFGSATSITYLLLGLAFGLPQVVKGLKNLSRAYHLLEAGEPPARLPAARPAEAGKALAAPATDPLSARLSDPGSVTDRTTLNLKPPDAG
jgi:hypothetical protein